MFSKLQQGVLVSLREGAGTADVIMGLLQVKAIFFKKLFVNALLFFSVIQDGIGFCYNSLGTLKARYEVMF